MSLWREAMKVFGVLLPMSVYLIFVIFAASWAILIGNAPFFGLTLTLKFFLDLGYVLLLQTLVQGIFSLTLQFIEDLQDLCSTQGAEVEEAIDPKVSIMGIYRQVPLIGGTR